MSAPLEIALDDEHARLLDEIAASRGVTPEAIVVEALSDYLAFQARQRAKIRDGIAAADRGEFASDEEVEQLFARYRTA
jgi:predicted transcriptional regulator